MTICHVEWRLCICPDEVPDGTYTRAWSRALAGSKVESGDNDGGEKFRNGEISKLRRLSLQPASYFETWITQHLGISDQEKEGLKTYTNPRSIKCPPPETPRNMQLEQHSQPTCPIRFAGQAGQSTTTGRWKSLGNSA